MLGNRKDNIFFMLGNRKAALVYVGTFLEHLKCCFILRTLEIISAKNQTLTHKK